MLTRLIKIEIPAMFGFNKGPELEVPILKKLYLFSVNRRVFIYSFVRVLCSFTSEREFSTYNPPK